MPVAPDAVASAYDRWAPTYDSDTNHTRDLDAAVLRTHGPEVRGQTVLELGGGTGKNTVWLAERASSVLSLDLSAPMQAVARERVAALGLPEGRVTFALHDLRQPWPVDSAVVHVVVSNLVLEHVQGLDAIFAEAARVLAPGGTLWVSELHPERQRRGAQAHFEAEDTGELVYVPAYRHTVSAYVNAAIGAGLRVRRVAEWLEDGADPLAAPRLFTMRAKR